MDAKAKKKRPGRPRKHNTAVERVRSYRQGKQAEGRRLDLYVSSKASWRLTALANAWGCSKAKAVERLLLESDERYETILFPET